MSWLRTDDGEADAPWVFQVGNEAYGLYVRLELYAARHLTDGKVPAGVVQGYLNGSKRPLLALEVVGRIERDRMGTVTLPHYLEHNPTRAEHDAAEQSRKHRAEHAARKRWSNARGNA